MFTGSELILLGVVAVTLFVYRQLDRGNRSLEKVKKYADKTLGEIDKYVESKAVGIRDYGIDLEVQQKAAKVLLDRIQAVEDSLNSRTDKIDLIDQRVAEYDRVVGELMEMTERAQENLRRLHEEASFIDGSMRRVQDAQAQLDKVEGELPAIRESMRAETRIDMETIRDNLVADLRAELSDAERALNDGAERAKQFEHFIADIERRREARVKAEEERIEAEFEAAFEKARSEALRLENMAFGKLKEGIQERAKKLQESLEEKYVQARDIAKEKLTETQGLLKNFKAEWQKESDDLANSMGERVDDLRARQDALEHQQTAFIAENRGKLVGYEREIGDRLEASQNRLDEGMSKIVAQGKDVDIRISSFSKDLESRLKKEAEALQSRLHLGIEEGLESFKTEVDYKFAKLEEANADIDQLDTSLRKSMTLIEEKLKDDFELFSQGLFEKQKEGEKRLEGDMAKLQKTMDEIDAELVTLKSAAYSNVSEKLKLLEDDFFSDIRKRSVDMNEKLDEWTNNLDSRLDGIANSGETGRLELEKRYGEQLKARLTEYGAKVKEQIDKITEYVQGHRNASQETIKAMIADFATQKKELIVNNQEERKLLRQELAENASLAERLSRELNEQADGKIREFRASVTEAQASFDLVHGRATAKIEEEMRRINSELSEIDKRQRAYLAQTKLFERTDELKGDLERDIETLRAELSRTARQKQELGNLEAEYGKIKKLEEDLNGKISRFLSEKRKIEAMDEDFKRLLGMSQSIEVKLKDLSASDDNLQELQIQMRKFADIAVESEARYDRLEKKNSVLDATTAGMDRNFQGMQNIERQVKSLDEQLKTLPAKVSSIQNDVGALMRDRDEIHNVTGKLKDLDATLRDIEGRADSMQKAREWLARTETRLEEVSRQAHDQVKLLESLVKAETKAGKSEKGAPPMNVRDTVVKLARQGWSVEEIARVTKLSRGEIELILEVSPKA